METKQRQEYLQGAHSLLGMVFMEVKIKIFKTDN
jgi:hypothetical protein